MANNSFHFLPVDMFFTVDIPSTMRYPKLNWLFSLIKYLGSVFQTVELGKARVTDNYREIFKISNLIRI